MAIQLNGQIVDATSLNGALIDSTLLNGSLVQSQFTIGDQLLRLAATDGEQIININVVNAIVITALPLQYLVSAGKVKFFQISLVAKTHDVQPNSIDIELFDSDNPSQSNPNEVFLSEVIGGSKSIFRVLPAPVPNNNQGDPLPNEEPLVNSPRVAERVFKTKGTTGNLGLAIRINTAGSSVDYDFKVQVNGEVLAT